MLLGRTCQNAGDHAQAIKAFDRAIEATVSNKHVILYSITLYGNNLIWPNPCDQMKKTACLKTKSR